jgi:hypothetical protein
VKKIGILTYHAAPNYGAVLQTYAQVFFHRSIGNSCKIINFVPAVLRPPYRSWIKGLLLFRILPMFKSILFYRKLSKFRKDYFDYDGKSFYLMEDFYSRDFDFDTVSVGSDQVWNPSWFFKDNYAWAYFLGYIDDEIKKVSLAASAGSGHFPKAHISRIIKDLQRFDRVGVREDDLAQSLRENGIDADHDFDPIFLLGKNEWSSFARGNWKSRGSKYVFLFFLHNELPIDISDIYSLFPEDTIFYTSSNSASLISGVKIRSLILSPQQWLQAIISSDIVLTNSFHAVAFSLIFNTEFFAFKRESVMNNRIKSLLKKFKLEHRFIDTIKEAKDCLKTGKVNWKGVNSIIEEESIKLKTVLKCM